MSTDADDKVQSKFPRSSLRARNKTLMITPADVADYQVKAEDRLTGVSGLGDVFEDTFSALGESDEGDGLTDHSMEGAGQTSALSQDQAEVRGVDALSDEWDSEELEEDDAAIPVSDDFSEVGRPEDIFAAPPGTSVRVDELFEPLAGAKTVDVQPDPIVRGVYSTSAGQQPAQLAPMSFEAQGLGSTLQHQTVAGDSVLQSTAQQLKDAQRRGPATGGREYVEWKKPSKLVGFLVSYVSDAMGSYIELREGRLLVTSGSNSTDSCLVINHESVSPMHSIMRMAADGSILILDQLSEHGTKIRRAESGKEESLMGDKSSLFHGDVVIFGECEYHVVVMGSAAFKKGN